MLNRLNSIVLHEMDIITHLRFPRVLSQDSPFMLIVLPNFYLKEYNHAFF